MLRRRAMCALSPVPRRAPFGFAGRAGLAGLLLTCLSPGLGCSKNNFATPGPDSAVPADDGSATDSSSSDASPACKVGRPTCVKSFISTCSSDGAAPELTPCDADCSLGRCTSPECAQSELADAARGCLFYGFRSDNIDTDIDRPTMLILSSSSARPADVRVESRGDDGTWTAIDTVQVPPLGGQRLSLRSPSPLANPGFLGRAAFRVVSTIPVMVVQLSSDDADGGSRSSGGTVLRPAQSLGFKHLAMTYPQLPSANVTATAGSRAGAGTIVIVATHDDTAVTVTPSTDALVTPDGIMISPANVPLVVDLSEGDTLQIVSANGGDLSGTRIESTHPIAAFSGNVYTTYGMEVTGFNGGDLTIEQLPPVESWGTEYVGAWLSPQSNCDPFFGPAAGLWTVMAADDGAQVSIVPAFGVTLSTVSNFALTGGQSQTFVVHGIPSTGGSPARPGDFYIRSSTGRILLGQWLECEPGLSWGIDTRHGQSALSVTLPPSFDHEIVVVREHKDTVLLDGVLDLEPRFLSTVNGGRYELGRISQQDLGVCADLADPCLHMIGAGAFGVTWRGMDVVCSYALTVPSRGTRCALPGESCPD
jgi:hypothetical protein